MIGTFRKIHRIAYCLRYCTGDNKIIVSKKQSNYKAITKKNRSNSTEIEIRKEIIVELVSFFLYVLVVIVTVIFLLAGLCPL